MFRPFLEYLATSGLSPKTIQKHVDSGGSSATFASATGRRLTDPSRHLQINMGGKNGFSEGRETVRVEWATLMLGAGSPLTDTRGRPCVADDERKTGKRRAVCYEGVNLIEGIIGSVIATVLVAIAIAVYRTHFGQRVAITDPTDHGQLGAAEQRAGITAHPVHGTVKHLPKGHRIWLVVIDEGGGKFWPQSFSPVETNEAKGTWKGYVHVWGWQNKWQNVTITAVIAPPTTQGYFNYFQRVGNKTGFEPLSGIPPECKWRATIHAKVPAAPTT